LWEGIVQRRLVRNLRQESATGAQEDRQGD
jgi:hypothetical protein